MRPTPGWPSAGRWRPGSASTTATAVDLTEQGTEKRLALYVVRDPADVPGVSRLGVDALDAGLDRGRLGDLLRGRPGTLKTVLADQSVIAGVGNAYSDEILHAARLSPFARADRLDGRRGRAPADGAP